MHKIDPADEAQLFATIDRWVEREVAPQVKDMIGRWLLRGTTFGLIVDPSGFERLSDQY